MPLELTLMCAILSMIKTAAQTDYSENASSLHGSRYTKIRFLIYVCDTCCKEENRILMT